MGRRLWYVAIALLGALLLGTAGLAVGSWYGGRGAAPLSPEAARSTAGELSGVEPIGSMTARGYRYGVFLAPDDVGGSRVEFQYGDGPDCTLSEQVRRAAETHGWRELRPVPAPRATAGGPSGTA
ncbi:hypothetical protein V2I01_05385 [Micromonospora sp. BRA006-A]|nr:hypothetical protein [Micromonospora sp. BRA006-A]